LYQRFSPLLKTYLEIISFDVVRDLQCFLFHFADGSKTFSFHLAFHMAEQEKVAGRKVGFNCVFVFNFFLFECHLFFRWTGTNGEIFFC